MTPPFDGLERSPHHKGGILIPLIVNKLHRAAKTDSPCWTDMTPPCARFENLTQHRGGYIHIYTVICLLYPGRLMLTHPLLTSWFPCDGLASHTFTGGGVCIKEIFTFHAYTNEQQSKTKLKPTLKMKVAYGPLPENFMFICKKKVNSTVGRLTLARSFFFPKTVYIHCTFTYTPPYTPLPRQSPL